VTLVARMAAILDCGADWLVREGRRKVADDAGAHFWLVDTVCSDVALHRRRSSRGVLEGRNRQDRWTDD
jgi:hypothetical protein